jgi:hypothetical protein
MFKKMVLALVVACAAGFAMPSKAEAGGCYHGGYGYGGGYHRGYYGGWGGPALYHRPIYARPSFYGPAFGPGFYGRGFGGPRGGLWIGF